MTITASEDKDTFNVRKESLLSGSLAKEPFGAEAILNLLRGDFSEQSKEQILHVANWFQSDDPLHEKFINEVDFAAIKLCRAWHLLQREEKLDTSIIEAIKRFFTQNQFCSKYQSENHALLYHTSLYLMSGVFYKDHFKLYNATGEEIARHESQWLKQFITYRARFGWGEFNSTRYLAADWECLLALHDFSPDPSLQANARNMLDVMFGEMLIESLNGMQGGAQGRIRPPEATDHRHEVTQAIHYLFAGAVPPPTTNMNGFIVDLLSTSYRPRPEMLTLYDPGSKPFVIKARKHLHNVADTLPVQPLEGSIKKYTYWSPEFILGCVQQQDAYPASTPHHSHISHYQVPSDQRETSAYAWHQQHDWDLTFAKSNTARIFAHHPGQDPSHNEWTGDRCCGCGQFMQEQRCLLAVYSIGVEQHFHYIHIYLPRDSFDEVRESGNSIYVRADNAYAALHLSNPYHWAISGDWVGSEIICPGRHHGIACEAGCESDDGSFDEFIARVSMQPITWDLEKLTITYKSSHSGELHLDARGNRLLNGNPIDLNYPSISSPRMSSTWGDSQYTFQSNQDQADLILSIG